jgi:hypothetical protein
LPSIAASVSSSHAGVSGSGVAAVGLLGADLEGLLAGHRGGDRDQFLRLADPHDLPCAEHLGEGAVAEGEDDFNESARLYPARSWLKDLKLRALQNSKHDHVFRTVMDKLCALLPGVERLDVVDNQVWAIAPKLGGRVPLAALSDGYLTTLGWLVDLVARWLHWAEQVEGKPPEGDFFERMEGLVLVDEIDLHLHPAWQRTILRDLKNTFPRLSFVASAPVSASASASAPAPTTLATAKASSPPIASSTGCAPEIARSSDIATITRSPPPVSRLASSTERFWSIG